MFCSFRELVTVRVGFAISTHQQNAVSRVIQYCSNATWIMNAEFKTVAKPIVKIISVQLKGKNMII